jgi:4-amino-4-deoxy-L-arabinose transferase-like glycosyltransferase
MRSERLDTQSSHWTIAIAKHWYGFAVLALTFVHIILAAYLPPTEDELYYWSWAQHLQWSYFDHPPMVAYIIAATTKILGNHPIAFRMGAIIISSAVLLLMSALCPKKGILALFLLTPIFLYGSVMITPDIPLVLFWTLYAIWLSGLNRTMSQWNGDPVTRVYRQNPIPMYQWAIGGLFLGLGLLSKYTMFLAIPCAFGVLASKYRLRAWLWGFCFHGIVAGIIATPVLIYNFQHHFAPLLFQFEHATYGGDISLRRMLDFVGVQTLILGALPFLFLPWISARGRELCSDPEHQVSFYFFVFPLLFFLYEATRTQVEANWPLVAYITLPILAQKVLDRTSFKGLARSALTIAFIPSLLCSAALFVHLIFPLKFIPIYKDRIGKLKGHFTLSQEVASDIRAQKETSVLFSPNYQWTAYFLYQGLSAKQMNPSSRQSEYTVRPTRMCDLESILVFSDTPTSDLSLETRNCFSHSQILKDYPLLIRNTEASRFYLVKYWR